MDISTLVEEITTLTGAAAPEMLDQDAPVLTPRVLEGAGGFYLIGLIGGKEVGKTALVNALAGRELSISSSHGAGTDRAIAYLHESQVEHVRPLLEEATQGRYLLMPHAIAALKLQVLVDLPDIDSHYEAHVAITRRLLRHMLFPIWMQSVEKYADDRPRRLLEAVAQGNSPENFLFCLNKADQVIRREGEKAAGELRDDYAARLARTLKLEHPPRVYLISATHADRCDLPELKRLLSRQKPTTGIEQSRRSAAQRRSETLLDWVGRQDLPGRLARLDRLHEQAAAILEERVTRPLLETGLAKLSEDPAWRASLADAVLERRLARWPLINLIQNLFGPAGRWVRQAASSAENISSFGNGEAVCRDMAHRALHEDQPPTDHRLASSFAHLQQTSPLIGELFAGRKLWEPMMAREATEDLSRRLAATLARQRQQVRQRLDRSWGPAGWIFRWLLTWGVVIWFVFRPILQPLLHGESFTVISLGWALLSLLQADYLLVTLIFLAAYFLLLWLILRGRTHRAIVRLLRRWGKSRRTDPALDLAAQAVQWSDELLDPIVQRKSQLKGIVNQIEQAATHRAA